MVRAGPEVASDTSKSQLYHHFADKGELDMAIDHVKSLAPEA